MYPSQQATKGSPKGESNAADQQDHEMLELSISKLAITNARIESASSQEKLQEHLALFKQTTFFQQTQWPQSDTTASRISSLFEKHPYDTFLYNNPLCVKADRLPEARPTNNLMQPYYTMTTDSLKRVRAKTSSVVSSSACFSSRRSTTFGTSLWRISTWSSHRLPRRKTFVWSSRT